MVPGKGYLYPHAVELWSAKQLARMAESKADPGHSPTNQGTVSESGPKRSSEEGEQLGVKEREGYYCEGK